MHAHPCRRWVVEYRRRLWVIGALARPGAALVAEPRPKEALAPQWQAVLFVLAE